MRQTESLSRRRLLGKTGRLCPAKQNLVLPRWLAAVLELEK